MKDKNKQTNKQTHDERTNKKKYIKEAVSCRLLHDAVQL